MSRRVVAFGVGALAMLGLGACGSAGGGTGAAPATTIQLGTASYQTYAPVVTSTTTVATVVGGAGVVAGEQQHTVVSGDYLVRIAKTYCVKLEDIVLFNGWADGANHVIYPGLKIKLPVKSG